MRSLIPSVLMTLVLTALTGIIYPFVVFGIAQVLFPWQANGSLVVANGHVVGSELIGQNFNSDRYFHPRPSAAGDKGYDASNSSGSNLGPSNKSLIDSVKLRLKNLLETDHGVRPDQVPIDMVTASGSGLDPDISPANAELQVERVAQARGMTNQQVEDLVTKSTSGRQAGLLGEPRVNVLMLNLALDQSKPDAPQHASR